MNQFNLSLISNKVMKQVKIEAKSDIGLKRQENEDSFLAESTENYILAVVADGMGGHRGGKDASLIAVNTIKRRVEEDFGKKKPEQIIIDAFTEADELIKDESEKKYGRHEMATTCSLILAVQPDITADSDTVAEIYSGHLGDSRIYRVRNSEIEKLSTDHTLMQTMMDSGALIEGEDNEDLPYGNLVYKSLGANTLEMDPVERYMLKKGDNIIICSDGLTRYLEDQEILGITLKNMDNNSSAADFIDIANDRGGEDNITVVSLRTELKEDSDNIAAPLSFYEEEQKFLCKLIVERNAAIFAALFFAILLIVSVTGALAD